MQYHCFMRMVLCATMAVGSAAADTLEWPLFGGNELHQRHSAAPRITPGNVSQLQTAWSYDTGISASFQATPIVQQGVMYVSLPFNDVVALDASTGQEIWRYRHDRDKSRKLCCGPANRGVAVSGDQVFMGTIDGRLIALNARDGSKRWDIDVIQGEFGIPEDIRSLGGPTKDIVSGTSGAGLNMAPMVFNDKVIIGITGVGYGLHLNSADADAPLGAVVGIAGQYGRRGFLAAYDIGTGERHWKFDTIPEEGWQGKFTAVTEDGVKLPRNIDQEKQQISRYPDAWRFGGGSAWTTPAIDHQTGILYFGTGNPSPQMESSSRPGDNLYTVSLVALDANTGRHIWHYQQVPHDIWGYDVASPPVLFSVSKKGEQIPAVGQAGKTGWFYVLHRQTGELIYKSEAFVPQHNQFAKPSPQGTIIYPGVMGGSNWSPVSVDESRRRVFVAGIHWPVEYTLHHRPAKEDKTALKYSSMSPLDNQQRYGILSAIDLDSGRIVWQHQTPNPLLGGILSTQTGLVFSGEGNGSLFALDADTGERLWSGETTAGVNAPPISYMVGDQQFIAVAVGGNKLFGYKRGQTIRAWTLP